MSTFDFSFSNFIQFCFVLETWGHIKRLFRSWTSFLFFQISSGQHILVTKNLIFVNNTHPTLVKLKYKINKLLYKSIFRREGNFWKWSAINKKNLYISIRIFTLAPFAFIGVQIVIFQKLILLVYRDTRKYWPILGNKILSTGEITSRHPDFIKVESSK